MINPAEGGDFHLAKTGDFGVAVDNVAIIGCLLRAIAAAATCRPFGKAARTACHAKPLAREMSYSSMQHVASSALPTEAGRVQSTAAVGTSQVALFHALSGNAPSSQFTTLRTSVRDAEGIHDE